MKNALQTLETKKNKKGFTLMEMLIVVAIIAILVAVAVPVFTSSLNKAKAATDDANFRSAMAASAAAYLQSQDGTTNEASGKYYGKDGTWQTNKANAYVAQQGNTGTPTSAYTRSAGYIILANDSGSAAWVSAS